MSDDKNILALIRDDTLVELLNEQFQQVDGFSISFSRPTANPIKTIKDIGQNAILFDFEPRFFDKIEYKKKIEEYSNFMPIMLLLNFDQSYNEFENTEPRFLSYLRKPFKFTSLINMLAGQIQMCQQVKEASLTIGPFIFRPNQKLLVNRDKQKEITLTDKENAILLYLYKAKRKVIAREILLQAVWGYNARVATHTLETYIYRLRQKIERNPSAAEILITASGGYKLQR